MLHLISTAKTFSSKPSSFINGLSGYEAYCFDSACALFLSYWQMEKRPRDFIPPEQEDATNWL